MELLTPLGLLAGLVIPAIIVLYMLKKRTRPQTVSSIMLWQRLERVNRPALRLSRLLRSLLLILQLMVALLLVLALARPVLNAMSGAGETRIIIIDTSISMGVREGGSTRLELAREQIGAQIRGKAPGDRFALIAMGTEATVLSGLSADSFALLAGLAQVEIDSPQANPNAALALGANMAAAEERARVIMYSDGCFGPLARLPLEDLQFVPLGSEEVENLLVEQVVLDGDRLYVTLFNNGTSAAGGQVEIGDSQGEPVGRREVRVELQERRVLVWRNLPSSPWLSARLVSPGDQLELDDVFYALGSQKTGEKLLLVSEGNLFLERALLLYPGLGVSRVAPTAYSDALAERYDLFVFDGFLPSRLPAAPVLVFDPPHPNPHFSTEAAAKVEHFHPLPHPLLDHVDFSEVSIGFGKAVGGGSGLLEFEGGFLAAAMERQGQPLVAFGFAVQAGDLPLRPAFPILLRNILDSFLGGEAPSALFTYGQKAPPGLTILAPGDSRPWPQGQKLGAGVYALARDKGEEHLAVNPPATTASLAARKELETPGGPLSGQGGAKAPFIRPLIFTALILLGLEWWVDNYGS